MQQIESLHAMTSTVAQRVGKRREALRRAGFRPVQLWVPDTVGRGSPKSAAANRSAFAAMPLTRVQVQPDAGNGLRVPSQVMVDKAVTVGRTKIGTAFGRLDADAMLAIERRLAVFLGIAK